MTITLTLVIDDRNVNDAVNNLITTAGSRTLTVDEFVDKYNEAAYGYTMPGKSAPSKKSAKKSGKKK